MVQDAEDSVELLLERLANGDAGLDEVAADFAARTWPPAATTPSDFQEAAARELDDPEPAVPDSWATVEAAYVNGRITADQYAKLFAARQGGQRSEG